MASEVKFITLNSNRRLQLRFAVLNLHLINCMKVFGVLLKHEFLLEWRQRNAIGGILLYVLSTVFVVYITFKVVPPLAWIAIYWVIMLFAGTNAIAKSFMQLSAGKMLYYYTTTHPILLLAAKLVYNTIILLCIHFITVGSLTVLVGNPIADLNWFLMIGSVGIIGFSAILTLVSAIAQKANNQSTLMAILSFPVLIPLLVLVIKLSKNALDGLDRSVSMSTLGNLMAIDVLVLAVALLLFPYLWRE